MGDDRSGFYQVYLGDKVVFYFCQDGFLVFLCKNMLDCVWGCLGFRDLMFCIEGFLLGWSCADFQFGILCWCIAYCVGVQVLVAMCIVIGCGGNGIVGVQYGYGYVRVYFVVWFRYIFFTRGAGRVSCGVFGKISSGQQCVVCFRRGIWCLGISSVRVFFVVLFFGLVFGQFFGVQGFVIFVDVSFLRCYVIMFNLNCLICNRE